jgi:hypothetical protein
MQEILAPGSRILRFAQFRDDKGSDSISVGESLAAAGIGKSQMQQGGRQPINL